MRLSLFSLVTGILLFASVQTGLGQPLTPDVPTNALASPQAGEAPPGNVPESPQASKELGVCLAEIENLRTQKTVMQTAAQDDELKKKIEILQKQIDVLEKLVKLLADQVKKQPASGQAVEQLQVQTATLEARSVQAARRDVELANAVDDLREHIDAQERYGPQLPAPLKELFFPSGTNETPLSIYGALAAGYTKIYGDRLTAANGAGRPPTPGGFYFGEFSPDFFLVLNNWILLAAEIAVGADGGASVGSFAEADFFVTDWLTIIGGRFVAPIGWYNLRINNPWVNKLPADAPGAGPLLWQQVLPPLSLLGVQATGAFYLGCSPIKMEYSVYISNGMNVTPAAAGAPVLDELANLENMTNTLNVFTNELALGGRVGFWYPEAGLETGFSALYNGPYIVGGLGNSISLMAVDFNYRKGGFEARAEYGMTVQQAQPFLTNDITRQGFYAQVAYRPIDCSTKLIQNLEFVYRYSYVDFRGLDPALLTLSSYTTPVDVPVRRQQNEFGLNYYFYPRMLLKGAFQINDEPGFHLHDNQFLTELAWGW